jgi:uncharacterized integral membrane protein (TIGR00697 family)
MNELILILSVFVIYGGVIFCYRFFGKGGLYGFTVLATLLANIEVLVLVNAFGMEQTLGNVLFASTYLVTDILSENEGKKAAGKAVNLGIFTAVFMVIITQSWFLYTPSENDWVTPALKEVFSVTPRLLAASFIGFAVSQKLDVFLYHKWWAFTEKRFGDKKRFLWLRNNGSTLISQVVNTLLFNLIAFYGVYDTKTLISIVVSSYLIYVVTSLVDTPFVYLARKLKKQ